MKTIKMIDISKKNISLREATAYARVLMSKETAKKIKNKEIPKGDVLTTAQLAGIMAAKNTPSIIPLCHPLSLTSVDISFKVKKDYIEITASVSARDRTGTEMEALVAASVAALSIYDMCKMVDRDITVENIYLIEKKGGKSGICRR